MNKHKSTRYMGGNVPTNIYERIKEIAAKEERPLCWVVNKLLEQGVGNYEKNNG